MMNVQSALLLRLELGSGLLRSVRAALAANCVNPLWYYCEDHEKSDIPQVLLPGEDLYEKFINFMTFTEQFCLEDRQFFCSSGMGYIL